MSNLNATPAPARQSRRRGPVARQAGEHEARALAAHLGRILRTGRIRLGWTQRELGARLGIGDARVSELERGKGASASLGLWIAAGIVIGQPLAISASRATKPDEPRDGGHLSAQELMLRLGRQWGRDSQMELRAGRGWQPFSIDVVQRDRFRRVLIITEIWNVIGDFGAAIRNHDRKLEAAVELAVVAGAGGEPFRVASCWVMRATAANRALVARYPEVIRARFQGSSRAWVDCLANGGDVPEQPGIVWVDLASKRLFEARLRDR